MKGFVAVLFSLFNGSVILGCDDAVLCEGGECESESECIGECEEVCDGAVFSAGCDVERVCVCECEVACL